MAKFTTIKCSHCDYEYEKDYYPSSFTTYKYKGITQTFEYPKVYTGWCINCNGFRSIAQGIKLKELLEKKANAIARLVKLGNKFINLSNSTSEIKQIINQIEAYSIIEYEMQGKDTVDTCIHCGKSQIIHKHISKPIWACPKCKNGILYLQTSNEDFLLRRGIAEIPFPKQSKKVYDLYDRIIICCFELMDNETAYLYNANLHNTLAALRKNFDHRFLDRISLIYSYIECIMLHKALPAAYIQKLIERIKQCLIISDNVDIKTVKERIEERIEYFKVEIEVGMECSHFIPAAIITTLRNPNNPPTHKITETDLIDAIKNWSLIAGTIKDCL